MADFSQLADEIAAVERQVGDAIFERVREQLRGEDVELAKELERRLAMVRRSLQKAEALLRNLSEV